MSKLTIEERIAKYDEQAAKLRAKLATQSDPRISKGLKLARDLAKFTEENDIELSDAVQVLRDNVEEWTREVLEAEAEEEE